MKKISLILILLLLPFSLFAQSMIEPEDKNINIELESNLLTNETTVPEEQEDNGGTTISLEIDLPFPEENILPSHPLYFLKKAWETVRSWFIFNAEKKAKYSIDLANKRLEEIEILAQNKKTGLINEGIEQYNKQLKKVNQKIEKAKSKGGNLKDINGLVQSYREKHETVFNQLIDQAPQETRQTIENARELALEELEILQEKINSSE